MSTSYQKEVEQKSMFPSEHTIGSYGVGAVRELCEG
jgi:hypothetical protein